MAVRHGDVRRVLSRAGLAAALYEKLRLGRKGAFVGAWLVSSVIFDLIHLPTNYWNLIRCIAVIGSARMVLTLPWIMTKNIWVTTGAHILNGWLLSGGKAISRGRR
jgi:membrane protease YdiL (CAAX protease family)